MVNTKSTPNSTKMFEENILLVPKDGYFYCNLILPQSIILNNLGKRLMSLKGCVISSFVWDIWSPWFSANLIYKHISRQFKYLLKRRFKMPLKNSVFLYLFFLLWGQVMEKGEKNGRLLYFPFFNLYLVVQM